MGKGPKPPDPYATADAQKGMNRDTAITQYRLGATNQRTPYGTSSYRQIGTWEDGTPRFEQTTAFSPEQQKLYELATQLQGRLGGIGNRLAGNVDSTLSQPFKLGNAETEGRLFSLGRSQLDPKYAEARASLEDKLINSGIRRGSSAWESSMREFGDQESRQYNDLLLSGRAQAANESLAERNQPLTELMALLGGSQPQSPQFQQTPQPGVAGVDLAGLVNQDYQNRLQRQQNNPMNSLFKLGSAFALGGWQ